MLIDVLRFAHLLTFAAVLCLETAMAFGAVTKPGRDATFRTAGRVALIALLPTGYTLAKELGWVEAPPAIFVALWVISGLWIALVVATHASTPRARIWLHRADVAWSSVLALGLTWDAWQGLLGQGHVLAPWLALKFAALALLIALRLWRRSPRILFVVVALAAAWLGTARPQIPYVSTLQETRHGSIQGIGDPTQAHRDHRSRSEEIGRVLS